MEQEHRTEEALSSEQREVSSQEIAYWRNNFSLAKTFNNDVMAIFF